MFAYRSASSLPPSDPENDEVCAAVPTTAKAARYQTFGGNNPTSDFRRQRQGAGVLSRPPPCRVGTNCERHGKLCPSLPFSGNDRLAAGIRDMASDDGVPAAKR